MAAPPRPARRKNRRPEARYAQLATVGLDGAPRCRTVVVRAVEAPLRALRFVTDARSEKAPELDAQPRASLCWYFAKTREQFRLRGAVERLEGAPRREAWGGMSPRGRASFLWPAPGTPRAEGDVFAEEAEAPDPPEVFLAYRLLVDEVDHLSLRGHPHDRRRWRGGDVEGELLRP